MLSLEVNLWNEEKYAQRLLEMSMYHKTPYIYVLYNSLKSNSFSICNLNSTKST